MHDSEQTIAPGVVPPILALIAPRFLRPSGARPECLSVIAEQYVRPDHHHQLWGKCGYGLDREMPMSLPSPLRVDPGLIAHYGPVTLPSARGPEMNVISVDETFR